MFFFFFFLFISCILCLTKELISESTFQTLAKQAVVIIIQIKISYEEISMLAQIFGLTVCFCLFSLPLPFSPPLYRVSSNSVIHPQTSPCVIIQCQILSCFFFFGVFFLRALAWSAYRNVLCFNKSFDFKLTFVYQSL